MAKKTVEETPVVANGLKEIVVDSPQTVELQQPAQKVSLNEVSSEVETPGHATRAFRG